MEKHFIHQYQSEACRSYNIMKERPSLDPLYGTICRNRLNNKRDILFIILLV